MSCLFKESMTNNQELLELHSMQALKNQTLLFHKIAIIESVLVIMHKSVLSLSYLME